MNLFTSFILLEVPVVSRYIIIEKIVSRLESCPRGRRWVEGPGPSGELRCPGKRVLTR